MEIGSRSAQRLYGQALDVASGSAKTAPETDLPLAGAAALAPEAAEAVSFSETVGDVASDMIDTLRQGEVAANAMMAGKADPHSVVEALAQTEMALEMAVTVRDRVVEAYQEILRMPV
ncbi:MAG: flagellar hook-basal body complex protein FliE [Pseudomonadota bacterium]